MEVNYDIKVRGFDGGGKVINDTNPAKGKFLVIACDSKEKRHLLQPLLSLPLYCQRENIRYFYYMKSILLGCLLALSPVKDQDYCNARFQFCITYPANFKGKGEAANGDGQEFVSADQKAHILAWGHLQFIDEDQPSRASLEAAFKDDVKDRGTQITYKVKKPTYYIISGTDKDGNTFYKKTTLKKIDYFGDKDTQVFQNIQFTYPPSQQAQYAAYCAYIAKAL